YPVVARRLSPWSRQDFPIHDEVFVAPPLWLRTAENLADRSIVKARSFCDADLGVLSCRPQFLDLVMRPARQTAIADASGSTFRQSVRSSDVLALSDEDDVFGFVIEAFLVFMFNLFAKWCFAVEGSRDERCYA